MTTTNPFHVSAAHRLIDRKCYGGQHAPSSMITDFHELTMTRAFGSVDDLDRLAEFDQHRVEAGGQFTTPF
jgi:hypothetical protein